MAAMLRATWPAESSISPALTTDRLAERLTSLISPVTSTVRRAVCCTLRAISCVAAPCCSTAAAIAVEMPLTSRMVAAIP